jgi:hypothetical protein
MSALSILVLVFVVGAAIIAIWSQLHPAPNLLWVSVILLCVALAILQLAGGEGVHRLGALKTGYQDRYFVDYRIADRRLAQFSYPPE